MMEEVRQEKNFYQLLGVEQNATSEEISDAWRQQKNGWGSLSPSKKEAFKILSNPDSRLRYDRKIGAIPRGFWDATFGNTWYGSKEESVGLYKENNDDRPSIYVDMSVRRSVKVGFDEKSEGFPVLLTELNRFFPNRRRDIESNYGLKWVEFCVCREEFLEKIIDFLVEGNSSFSRHPQKMHRFFRDLDEKSIDKKFSVPKTLSFLKLKQYLLVDSLGTYGWGYLPWKEKGSEIALTQDDLHSVCVKLQELCLIKVPTKEQITSINKFLNVFKALHELENTTLDVDETDLPRFTGIDKAFFQIQRHICNLEEQKEIEFTTLANALKISRDAYCNDPSKKNGKRLIDLVQMLDVLIDNEVGIDKKRQAIETFQNGDDTPITRKIVSAAIGFLIGAAIGLVIGALIAAGPAGALAVITEHSMNANIGMGIGFGSSIGGAVGAFSGLKASMWHHRRNTRHEEEIVSSAKNIVAPSPSGP